MESPSPPVLDGPAIKPTSDASFSSGASRTSTRPSSPASSSHRLSPLVDLDHFDALNVDPASNTLLDLDSDMERNAFQSVNMRRDKLTTERGIEGTTNDSTSQLPQPFQQPQTFRPGTSVGSQAARSLTSNNWRTQTQPPNDSVYSLFKSASGVPIGSGSHGAASFPANTQLGTDSCAALPFHCSMVTSSNSQLDSCYAYCFERGNGQYTRLIPADMLPPLQNIQALQQGREGMIVLPVPRAFPLTGRSGNTDLVLSKVSIPPVARRTSANAWPPEKC